MTQKILAGRADDPNLNGDLVRVKVDQVVLARQPDRTLAEPVLAGAKKCAVEVGIVYDTRCVTALSDTSPGLSLRGAKDALNLGMLIARPGIGFPGPVHLERFAAPARLALTDEEVEAMRDDQSAACDVTIPVTLVTRRSCGCAS